jgi:hypothetical protein
MKPLAITAACVAAFLVGIACGPSRVITKADESTMALLESERNVSTNRATAIHELEQEVAKANARVGESWKKGWQTGWRVGWEVGWEARGK